MARLAIRDLIKSCSWITSSNSINHELMIPNLPRIIKGTKLTRYPIRPYSKGGKGEKTKRRRERIENEIHQLEKIYF